MVRKERRRFGGEATKKKLLDSAWTEFLRVGWEGTSGIAIREAVGLSHGSWAYAYPGGKPQVAAEIYEVLHAEIWTGCLRALVETAWRRAAATLEDAMSALNDAIAAELQRARLMFELQRVLPNVGFTDVVEARGRQELEALRTWAIKAELVVDASLSLELLRALLFGPLILYTQTRSDDAGAKERSAGLERLVDVAKASVIALRKGPEKPRRTGERDSAFSLPLHGE